MNFIHFSEVDLSKESSWSGKAILSLDIDWASDEVLHEVLDLFEEKGLKACFFVTHQTPVLDRLRNIPNIELGIHPNFDPLFINPNGYVAPRKIVEDLKNIVPEAKVVRSHSMTHSGRLLSIFGELGFTHSSQFFLNKTSRIQPLSHINGITEVPVFLADDGILYESERGDYVLSDAEKFLKRDPNSIRVFNFHPIHLALNSPDFKFYSSQKGKLKVHKYDGYGALTLLEKLLTEFNA